MKWVTQKENWRMMPEKVHDCFEYEDDIIAVVVTYDEFRDKNFVWGA